MAVVNFTVWNNQTFVKPQNLVSGVPVTLAVSQEFSNTNAQRGLRLTTTYQNLVPNNNENGPAGVTYELGLIIEGRDSIGSWFPIGYQFSSVKQNDQAPKRIIVLEPAISDINAGIDDVIYVGGRELARISRQQGSVPATAFRVSLILNELNPEGIGSFQSVTLSCVGEKYDIE
jgi:hypothetical protein